METINIKFDEEQLKDIVEKVKEAKKDSITKLTYEEPKKNIRLYLEANETDEESVKEKIYFGYNYNTLSKACSSQFDLASKFELKEVNRLKRLGWKEEVVYK